jgi:Protein of unknown function (DUF2924)
MLKHADQRAADIAITRTAVVQPLQPKKTASTSARKNKGEQTSKQSRVLAMLRAPAGATIAARSAASLPVWCARSSACYESDRLAAAFVSRHTTYASLSAIACNITGTAWNGPRFFGLRAGGNRPEVIEGTPAGSHTGIAAVGRLRRSSVSATRQTVSLRDLHAKIDRRRPGAGIQLARCPARSLRSLHLVAEA